MMRSPTGQLFRDISGATAIEYAAVAFFIAIVALAAINNLGGSLKNKYDGINQNVSDAMK